MIITLMLILGFIYLLLVNRQFLLSYLLLYYIVSSVISLARRKALGRELLIITGQEPGYYQKLSILGLTVYFLAMVILAVMVIVRGDFYLEIALILGAIALFLMIISYRTFRRRVILEKGISGRECLHIQWKDIDSIYWDEKREYLVIFFRQANKEQFLRPIKIRVDERVKNELEILLRKIFRENKIKDYQKNGKEMS